MIPYYEANRSTLSSWVTFHRHMQFLILRVYNLLNQFDIDRFCLIDILARLEKTEDKDLVSGNFIWKIDGFSNLINDKCYSDVFGIGGLKWRISLAASVELVSVYLEVADASTLPDGWTRYAESSLTMVNQLDRKLSITQETKQVFNAKESDWGFTSFMPFSHISESYLVDDTCTVETKVSIRKSDIKILDKETGELVYFRGIGKIDLAFHPLLEEVCLLHPLLIKSQQKRSGAYVERALATLGRLLHFLKTKNVKDLNQDEFERLQLLWEELEAFNFDLAWLQPHVQLVSGMKSMHGEKSA